MKSGGRLCERSLATGMTSPRGYERVEEGETVEQRGMQGKGKDVRQLERAIGGVAGEA